MRPKAVSSLLCVADLDRSIAFYAQLGLRVEVRWDSYARLGAGGSGSALHLAVPGDPPPDRPSVALTTPEASSTVSTLLVIEVDDCVAAASRLQLAGVALLGGPGVPPWGGEVRAFLRDPDGHLIELNQPLARAVAGPAGPPGPDLP